MGLFQKLSHVILLLVKESWWQVGIERRRSILVVTRLSFWKDFVVERWWWIVIEGGGELLLEWKETTALAVHT